jgi:hypothetical protein
MNYKALLPEPLAKLQAYANAIVAAGVCDVDAQAFTAGAPFLMPGMRQLRRGSKKKVTP